MDINKLARLGDVFAIPCFFVLAIYFIKKKNKSLLEYLLLIFTVTALICDILFVYYSDHRLFVDL